MAYVNLGQVIYPVGAIFASTSSTSPSSMFGGTWSEIVGDSCLMACSGNVGVYGGSKNITIENMPPHNHAIGWYSVDGTFQIDYPVDCTHRGLQNGWTGIHTMPEGGGSTICLTPTDAICGGEQLNSSDASCVTSKTSKSELVQALKQFVHSQLEQYTNLLVQQVQPVSMAEDGHLSQMVDSLDRKGLGTILVEKMSISLLLRKCQAIAMNSKLLSNSLETPIDVATILVKVTLFYMTILRLRILRGMETHITIFPRIEHATAGIELPNILGGVLC
jgi:hypothetical protein